MPYCDITRHNTVSYAHEVLNVCDFLLCRCVQVHWVIIFKHIRMFQLKILRNLTFFLHLVTDDIIQARATVDIMQAKLIHAKVTADIMQAG